MTKQCSVGGCELTVPHAHMNADRVRSEAGALALQVGYYRQHSDPQWRGWYSSWILGAGVHHGYLDHVGGWTCEVFESGRHVVI